MFKIEFYTFWNFYIGDRGGQISWFETKCIFLYYHLFFIPEERNVSYFRCFKHDKLVF